MGHLVGRDGIRKSPEFIQKIAEYPKPQNVTQLRQFLGLVNFQRKLIDKCSVVAKPLSELTGGSKSKLLVWSSEMEDSFESLKSALVQDVTLSFPDYCDTADKLELFVDASSNGAGACLMQRQNGHYKTIAYSSMTFTPTQRRYSTIERELVALRWGIKSVRPFVFAVPFVLYTDHKPLLYLNNMARDNSRLMKIMSELAEYDFIIRYRPGKENCAADAMSRVMTVLQEDEVDFNINNELPPGLMIPGMVEGGGDSFFESLFVSLKCVKEDIAMELPENFHELRYQLVDFLVDNASKFNVKKNADFIKRIRVMRRQSQLPCLV